MEDKLYTDKYFYIAKNLTKLFRLDFKYLLCFTLMISACSTSKKTIPTPTQPTKETPTKGTQNTGGSKQKSLEDMALENINTLTNATPNLYLDGTMRVSGVPIGINFEAVIKRKDSLKLVLTGPFGYYVGALMATPDKFMFYDAREDVLIEGTPNKATFKKLIQIELDYQDIVALLRGELANIPQTGSHTTKTNGDSIFYGTNTIPKEEFVILPKLNLIANYTRFLASGNTASKEIAVRYSEHKTIAGKREFAMKSEALMYSSNQNLRLIIDEVKTELSNDQNCVIDFPKNVQRKKI